LTDDTIGSMKKVPKAIYDHVSNAKLYFEAAQKFPPPTNFAVQILLLLVSWENIVIADKKLDAWAQRSAIDEKLLKDHREKFKGAPGISKSNSWTTWDSSQGGRVLDP